MAGVLGSRLTKNSIRLVRELKVGGEVELVESRRTFGQDV